MAPMCSAESPSGLTDEQRNALLTLARDSIRHGLAHGRPLRIDLSNLASDLKVERATFVTLLLHGHLRGCIGTLEAHRPLAEDIAANAYAAAFRDPRFPPVTRAEADELEIHLSLLTPAERLTFASEAQLLDQLRPGVDGLILEEGARRGTFLPSVWESLPEPRQFLRHLKQKAGLPEDYWSDTLTVSRYRCDVVP
jgi:uncharacterized protein